jgi:nicotinate-nucleotide pyrophosphorylase (carboxylating)
VTAVAPVRRHLTEEILADVRGVHRAVVSPTEAGVVAGVEALRELTATGHLGRCVLLCAGGQTVTAGTPIAEITGTATQLAAAEDVVLGPLGFAGGIARRCRDIMAGRPDGLRVVCGGWKKLPNALKPLLRDALAAGGVAPRLVDGEFVYVDKNVVTLSGGVGAAVGAASRLNHGPVAVQVTTPEAAIAAVLAGARVIMDDTGALDSLQAVDQALRDKGFRGDVMLAFAGGVSVQDLEEVRRKGADIVDLGRAILDAPLWDLHMVVES